MKKPKPKRTMIQMVEVGVVGVDSGQVMICDPCYIRSEWKRNEGDEIGESHDVYLDTKTKKLWQFRYANREVINGVHPFPGTFDTGIPECGGKTPNQLIASKRWVIAPERDQVRGKYKGEFSYRGCCDTTAGPGEKPPYGQLVYKAGHAGAGVVSRTMCGDGSYPVYALLGLEGDRPLGLFIDFEVSDYKGINQKLVSMAELMDRLLLKAVTGKAKAGKKR